MQEDLDRIDRGILSHLQENAGLSATDVSEKVGISQSQCWRRIQRLREVGFIMRQVTLLDRRRLGLRAQLFAQIKLSAHGRTNFSDFEDAVKKIPEVLECYMILGVYDFLLRIVTVDVDDYERIIFKHLSEIPGVQEINSTIALSEVKYTTSLPIHSHDVHK